MTQFRSGEIVRVVDDEYSGAANLVNGEEVEIVRPNYTQSWDDKEFVDVKRPGEGKVLGMLYTRRFEKIETPVTGCGFKVGDVVRVIKPTPGLPLGTATVTDVYSNLSYGDLFLEVQYESGSKSRGWCLDRFELVPPAPKFVEGDLVELANKDGIIAMAAKEGARGTVGPKGLHKSVYCGDKQLLDIVWDPTDDRRNGQFNDGYYAQNFAKVVVNEAPQIEEDHEASNEEFIVCDGDEYVFSSGWETYEEALEEAKKSARDDDEVTYYVYKRVAAVSSITEVEVLEG